jgi:hypothetical protein
VHESAGIFQAKNTGAQKLHSAYSWFKAEKKVFNCILRRIDLEGPTARAK